VSTGSDGPLWAGRFSRPPAPEARALGRSWDYDKRLAPHDVAASIAHVGALREGGVLNDDEAQRLVETLTQVGRDLAEGRIEADPDDEDIHSVVERAVTDRLGDLGARLHAG
jgi:argininosuccinate lyase